MRAYLKLVWTGLALMLVFFVATFPARTAFSWFAPAGIGGFGFEGTLWNGRARIISVGGLQLRNTEWDLAVSYLLTGRLAGDIKTRWNGGFVEGFAAAGLGGTFSLNDAVISMDVALLDSLLDLPAAGGQLSAELQEVELRDNWPHRLVGTGELRNFSSPMLGEGGAAIIGNIGFEFNTATETEADTITGTLKDTGGPLEVIGSVLLTPPGNYEIKARLKARDEALPALRRNLNFLGAPEADGMHIFQLAGSI